MTNPAPARDATAPIIVGGCPSSGTTLVRAILDSHSHIFCGPELGLFDRGFIYTFPYPRFRALIEITPPILAQPFRVTGQSNFKFNPVAQVLDASAIVLTHTHFSPGLEFAGTNIYDYVADWDQLVRMAKTARSYAQLLELLFAGLLAKHRKQRWAEKTPENILYARQCLESFPHFVFVHVMRHPMDTITSMITRKRNPFTLEAALRRYALTMEARQECVGHERFFEIRYEDLVTQPRPAVAALMEFLGLAMEASQLEFHKVERAGVGEYATTPIFTTSVSRWRRDLPPETARQIADFLRARGLDERTGYPMAGEFPA